MTLNGRNVTLAEITKFPELKFALNQNPRKVYSGHKREQN